MPFIGPCWGIAGCMQGRDSVGAHVRRDDVGIVPYRRIIKRLGFGLKAGAPLHIDQLGREPVQTVPPQQQTDFSILLGGSCIKAQPCLASYQVSPMAASATMGTER